MENYEQKLALIPDETDETKNAIKMLQVTEVNKILFEFARFANESIKFRKCNASKTRFTFNFKREDWNMIPDDVKKELGKKGYYPVVPVVRDEERELQCKIQHAWVTIEFFFQNND
jgi:hypothetical protein